MDELTSICNVLDPYFIELEIPGAITYYYYTAESVIAMRLVNLWSVTCYTDQNFKENAHFGALNLCTLDLDVDFDHQHFKLSLFVNEGDEKLTRNLIEEDSSERW